jgi:hypothetical protein
VKQVRELGSETKGGAMTISQGKSWPWSLERKLFTKSSVAEAPLFIFQLAAKIGLRFIGVLGVCVVKKIRRR